MSTYHLQIVTPDGERFDGQAEKLIVRTTTGDVGILARHTNYVTALGMGVAKVWVDGAERRAACIGGMLSVLHGEVRLLASTFEWGEDIDVARAQRSEELARSILDQADRHSSEDLDLAEARLRRALIRQSAAEPQ